MVSIITMCFPIDSGEQSRYRHRNRSLSLTLLGFRMPPPPTTLQNVRTNSFESFFVDIRNNYDLNIEKK